ncbi:MAG: transketolase family protein [Treponema sp.]|jgi:transketolase|nr:transketolase family protein [Treponema sp.]
MNVKLLDKYGPSTQDMRNVYCDTLLQLGRKDKRVMIIDNDCSNSMGTAPFRKELPAQYINAGIQEANSIGVAAGLSLEGYIPFVNAFGVFATRRAYDQVFLSCGYARLNVKILGWDPGVCAVSNGGTHMPFEDVALMRVIPDMVVLEPTDTMAFAALLEKAADHEGNVYIRTQRRASTAIYQEGSEFKIGGSSLLRKGNDLTILATGLLVSDALAAAADLAKDHINVRVIDMYSLKPIDEKAILSAAVETGAIVTVENASRIGGLYSAVCDYLASSNPIPVIAVAVNDEFGEVGDLDYLKKRFGLTAADISEKARMVLRQKSDYAGKSGGINSPGF